MDITCHHGRNYHYFSSKHLSMIVRFNKYYQKVEIFLLLDEIHIIISKEKTTITKNGIVVFL